MFAYLTTLFPSTNSYRIQLEQMNAEWMQFNEQLKALNAKLERQLQEYSNVCDECKRKATEPVEKGEKAKNGSNE